MSVGMNFYVCSMVLLAVGCWLYEIMKVIRVPRGRGHCHNNMPRARGDSIHLHNVCNLFILTRLFSFFGPALFFLFLG
jgi:hypothetical protein